jgi:hypothetical protein
MGRLAMTKLEKIMKIKIAETIIFPIVTYGSESWTVRKEELWMWRKILRIP